MGLKSWWQSLFKNEIKSISLDELADLINSNLNLSPAGVSVTPEKAMRQATFYACVKIISESISQLPLILYQRDGDTRKRAIKHPLYDLLKTQPNDFQTSSEFWQFIAACVVARGVGYAQKVKTAAGRVIGLNPLPIDATEEIWAGNERVYRITTSSGAVVDLPASDVFCVKGLTLDGKTPVSPVGYMRSCLGLTMAAEDFGSRFFGNNARPAGILESDAALKPETVENIKTLWNESHGGENMHKLAVLSGGLKFKPITMSAEDSQFLETRKFQRSEICGIFRVPPHMIGDTEKSSSWGTGIEQLTMGFIKFTLGPWMMRLEQTVERDLLTPRERQEYYAEFLTENLLRGDLKSRNEAYQIALGGNQQPGYMTINEVRQKENMPPIEGGDAVYQPLTGERTATDENTQQAAV